MKVDFANGDFEFISKPGEWCYEGGITIRWQNQRELYYRAMPKNYATGQEHIKLDLITKRNSKLEELGI